MPIDLPIGYKFACFALEGPGLDVGHRAPLHLGEGLWVVFGPPFELDEAWREWLGSIEADRLQRCNVTLLAVSPSQHPEVLDNENQALTQRALSLFYALFMVEIFRYEGGIALSGANVDGRVTVRQTSRIQEHYPLAQFQFANLRRVHFRRMARIAGGIRAVHIPGTETNRFQRGFHAWIRAIQELYGDERLHQLVRAIEAVVKPAEGSGRRHFVLRGQLFVGESPQNATMLEEIFNMRGSTEHLNPLTNALQIYPEENRRTIAQQRLCQTQLLASYIYEVILGDAALPALFTSDDRIAAFWQLQRTEQRREWGGGHLDWVAWIRSRFQI
jgi:hypothetical protein